MYIRENQQLQLIIQNKIGNIYAYPRRYTVIYDPNANKIIVTISHEFEENKINPSAETIYAEWTYFGDKRVLIVYVDENNTYDLDTDSKIIFINQAILKADEEFIKNNLELLNDSIYRGYFNKDGIVVNYGFVGPLKQYIY